MVIDQPKVMLGKALSGIARCIYMGDRQDITQYSIRSGSICISGITGRFCWYRNFRFFAIRYTKVSGIARSGIARADCSYDTRIMTGMTKGAIAFT